VNSLSESIDPIFGALDAIAKRTRTAPLNEELGTVHSVSEGTVKLYGLSDIGLEEVVRFEGGELGIAMTLEPDEIGVVLLDPGERIRAGASVSRTGTQLMVPVGPALLGRTVDGAGRPLDGKGPVKSTRHRNAESPAPPILDRAGVDRPLQTGLKVVDALVPIGRGQRELIVGERLTGKTSIALDTIINQRGKGVTCVYCAIGQRDSAVTRVLSELERYQASDYTCVVVARAEDPPGLQYIAPYTATAIAEEAMLNGQDALVVYDDLTQHALAYRELSLLLRRPPGREAFPGDVFYLHSRLLERATRLRDELGGGTLTALPVCALESDSLSSYIPTNLISITDGQLVLSARLVQRGSLPAVDVGRSVSRVGGDAQFPAYREFLSALKLEYAQFEELESFARFDTRLSAESLQILERGRRIRAVFRQPRYELLDATSQIAIFQAAVSGHLDELPVEQIPQWQARLVSVIQEKGSELKEAIESGRQLSAEERRHMLDLIQQTLATGDEHA
jgi:F-type H+-transporting ATPase subunit alpha